MVKGLLRAEDVDRAIAVGADAVQIFNHGGRQFDASPAVLEVLPGLRRVAGKRAKFFFDSAASAAASTSSGHLRAAPTSSSSAVPT